MSYTYYLSSGKLIRDIDQVVLPLDYPTYAENRAEAIEYGNEPEPINLQVIIVDAVQNYLDNTAKTRNYDGILSLCTYANSTILKFKDEGQAGVNWRDACWSTCYQIMYDVQTGQRQLPSVEQVLSELPQIVW